MKEEDKRSRFILASMNEVHNMADEIYEDLMDAEYFNASRKIKSLISFLQELNQTFNDEF